MNDGPHGSPGTSITNEIRSLDPERDHQRIMLLSTRCEFPFDTTRALEFALFRTFAVPSISGLLDRTGEFQRRPQKRYDDTDILVSELMEWGYDSERGRAALRRMNQIHGRFNINNADYLYVLSTFIYEPIRWNARFGWRPLGENEKLAMFHFWRAVGQRMGIRDVPDSFEAFEQYNLAYERDHCRPAATNHRVGAAIREMMAGWFPAPLRPVVRRMIYALMDEPLLEAFGFPRPARFWRWVLNAGMKSRAFVLRFLPRRRAPSLRTAMRQRTYPDGYHVDRLGPEPPGRA
ncbi:MAG: DUF2236 domain-containing protein [Planctomycetes bacterium]|nr:DUF2236 domain-containing protein [Planctomycetota bacterium]